MCISVNDFCMFLQTFYIVIINRPQNITENVFVVKYSGQLSAIFSMKVKTVKLTMCPSLMEGSWTWSSTSEW